MTRGPRILLVSFYFYPYNGCGFAIRAIKLAKQLHRQGFEVHVLSGGWESEAGDPSYGHDTEGLHLHVANPRPAPPSVADSLSRPDYMRFAGRVLRSVIPFPDNRFRFLPRMTRVIRDLIQAHDIQLMLVTLPPSSTGLLVPLLRRHFPQLPMVLEFRDMWALDPLATPRHAWFRWCQQRLERWTLNQCDLVVSCTPGFTHWVKRQLRDPDRALTILSGYDEDDFDFDPSPPEPGRCIIAYAGTTGGVSGPRTLQNIAEALTRVFEQRPELKQELVVDVIGHCTEQTRQQIAGFTHADSFRLKGFMPHDQALRELDRADILLLNLFDAPGIDLVYPGKIWEYMRLGKPIWIASPPGLLQQLATQTHKLGEWADFNDPAGLARALRTLLDRRADFASHYEIGRTRYPQYACETLFAEYGQRLRDLVARTPSPRMPN